MLEFDFRHKLQVIGLRLDDNAWAEVDELVDRVNQHGISMTRELLETIVHSDDKQRFAFKADHSHVRANQGHAVAIDSGLSAQQLPPMVVQDTARRFLASIRSQGLISGQRQHVPLC